MDKAEAYSLLSDIPFDEMIERFNSFTPKQKEALNTIIFNDVMPTLKAIETKIISNSSLYYPHVKLRETIREENTLFLATKNFSTRFFIEQKRGAEIFVSGDDFLITSQFSNIIDLSYLRSFRLGKQPGIYIIFNDTHFYVGQTAASIINRLASHQSNSTKKDALKKGAVFFFGRSDGKLGKDQLDYIESLLIKTLKKGSRIAVNKNNGNLSYIGDSNKLIVDYLLREIYQIAFFTDRNPFIENKIRKARFQFNSLISSTINDLHFLKSLQQEALNKELEKLARDYYKELVVIEYPWPKDTTRLMAPLDKPKENQYYLACRDGVWPQEENEIKSFNKKLLSNYIRNHKGKA